MHLLILTLFFCAFISYSQEKTTTVPQKQELPAIEKSTTLTRQEMLDYQNEFVDLIVTFKESERLFARLNGELEGIEGDQKAQIRQLKRSRRDLDNLRTTYRALGPRLVQLQAKTDIWLKRSDLDSSFRSYLLDAQQRCKLLRKRYDRDQEELASLPSLLEMRLNFIRLQNREGDK